MMIYRLLRCAGCGRGGISEIICDGNGQPRHLHKFYPLSISTLSIPADVPDKISREFREAELCAAHGANRAASALFRSTLEKTLKENGYVKGSLYDKIDEAGSDGIITGTLRKKAHDEIRVLGNDVLHDAWREITPEEVEDSHKYTQRILEAFYDHRPTVEAELTTKGRLTAPATTP